LLAARIGIGNPTQAEGWELQAIASSVIGGTSLFGAVGSVHGPLLGAFILATINNGANLLNVNSFWQRIITGALIIIIVYFDSRAAAASKFFPVPLAREIEGRRYHELDCSMKAVVCRSPGDLVLEDRAAPGAPPAGWARVAVSHVGICGTDYHIFEGKHRSSPTRASSGHEVSGTVVDKGEGVALGVGEAVIINPYLACGKCIACRQASPIAASGSRCSASIATAPCANRSWCRRIIFTRQTAYRRPTPRRWNSWQSARMRCAARGPIPAPARWSSAPGRSGSAPRCLPASPG
jgi:hypothetical protein